MWDKESIIYLLESNPQAVLRAILVIWNNQTPEEKMLMFPEVINNVGFNKYDAPFLSQVARKLEKHNKLTLEEFLEARRRIRKYWKQIQEAIILKQRAMEYKPQFEKTPNCDYMICDECSHRSCGCPED